MLVKVSRGFTLIELLIVILLINILLTLFIPILDKVKQKTYTVQCTYTLKGLGTACYAYALNYAGMLPHEDNGSGGMEPFNSCWYDVLPAYINGDRNSKNSMKFCQESYLGYDDLYNSETKICYSYKMNSRLEDFRGSPQFRRISSVKNPSSTVLFFDGRLDKKYYQYRAYGIFKAVFQRHYGKANILFMDGHVDTLFNENSVNNYWLDDNGLMWDPEKKR